MKRVILQCLLIVCAFLVVLSSSIYAAPVGKITKLEGRVDVLKAGQRTVTGVSLGASVDVGDIYRAKTNSRAEITFFNKNILRIHPATRVQVSQYSDDENTSSQVMKMDRGKVEAVSSQEFIKKVSSFAEGNKFEVHTPNAVAGIRGSGMTIGFAQMVTGLFFSTGRGYFYNPNQPGIVRNVSAGFVSFVVGAGGIPSRPVPGNVSYVGGSGSGTLPGSGDTGTTGGSSIPGFNIQMASLTNPIDQTFTFTPPPQIPNVLVGAIPSMTGGFGNPEIGMDLSINNVKFYGPSMIGEPTTWQADSVTGSFRNFDGVPNTLGIVVSGSGMSAYLMAEGSDTDFNGTWTASIANGSAPAGVGSYTQPFSFSGTASGTWSANWCGTGTLSGTGSGVVPSVLTQDPVVTQIVFVGAIPAIEGSVGGADWIQVKMNDVKFWGPSTTSQPHTWTSASVTGNYGGNPANVVGQPISMTSSNPVAISKMTVNSFSGGSWTGTISDGNAPGGVGTFPQPVGFDGNSTGTYSGSTLSGAASGKAYPGAAIPPS